MFGQIRNLREPRGTQKFFHPVARIALSQPGNRRIHGDHQSRKTGAASPVESAFRGLASAHEIQLIPNRAPRTSFHVLQLVAGDRREDVPGARLPSLMSRGNFALGVHQAAVADGSQHRRERKFMPENARPNIAIADRHRTARTKQNVAKRAAVFP